MTDTSRLKTELGRIRGAIESGSLDRNTALDALDKAEKALDAKTPAEQPQPFVTKPVTSANPVPEQVGKPFVPGGTVMAAPYPPAAPPRDGTRDF